jgi:hypothetical protein
MVRRRRRSSIASDSTVVEAFGFILIAIVLVGIVVACLSFIGSGEVYRGLGRTGGLSLDEPDMRPDPIPGSPAADAEAREEIRQMLEAKSARSEARGMGPIDIDAEMAALTAPSSQSVQDPALREEVRQLVVARNQRRMRKGEDPLDVEAEIDRELRRLT